MSASNSSSSMPSAHHAHNCAGLPSYGAIHSVQRAPLPSWIRCHLPVICAARCREQRMGSAVRPRSDDLEAVRLDLEPHSDLALHVDLWGFEPQTSCMPCKRSTN